MELKVLVDGVERVVCGITEQTTVQEVVIALAQATGRTGRYTLVERYRDTERLLPPAETPLTVLQRWGTHQEDVSFILRRSGTSEIAKDSKFDKNQQIRQSLPAQTAKQRNQQNGLVRNERNEKNRKSLGPAMRIRGDSSASLPISAGGGVNRSFNSTPNIRSRSPQRRLSPTRNIRPPSKTRQPSPNRAGLDTRKGMLNKIVLEQQQTIKELDEIVSRLNSNITKFDHANGNHKDEERRLNDIIRQNEAKILEEIERRNRNETARRNLENEIRLSKQELQKIETQIQKNQALEKTYVKQLDEKMNALELQRQAKSRDASVAQEELRRLSVELRKVDQEVHDKNEKIEILNRDLRKVNLQSFVRESNSTKVTVLPEAVRSEPTHRVTEPKKLVEPKQNEASSGVWV